jgi:uncharacterized membrane protein
MISRLIRYFLQGLLFTAPIFIVFYVIVQIFLQIGKVLNILGITIHPMVDPLLGLFLLFFFIVLIGFLGSSILFRPLFNFIEKLLEKAPLIKTMYAAVKDLLSAFVGTKKSFNQPVLFKPNKNEDIERLGFITCSDLKELGIGGSKVAVYIPLSYSIAGVVFIVPQENIKPINVPPADLMKFIISGGVSD